MTFCPLFIVHGEISINEIKYSVFPIIIITDSRELCEIVKCETKTMYRMNYLCMIDDIVNDFCRQSFIVLSYISKLDYLSRYNILNIK